MYNNEVAELYKIVPHGTPVVIINGSFGAFGSGFKNIKPGDRGADVYAIQQRLKQLGYFKGFEGRRDNTMELAKKYKKW